MKKFLNSISGKFILIGLGLALFWILSAFLVVDRLNTSRHIHTIQNLMNDNLTRAYALEAHSKALTLSASLGGLPANTTNYGESEHLRWKIITSLNSLESDPFLSDNIELSRRIRMIKESCSELNRIEKQYIDLLNQKGDIASGLILKIHTLTERLGQSGTAFPLNIKEQLEKALISYRLKNDPEILELMINELEIYNSGNQLIGNNEQTAILTEQQSLPVQLKLNLERLLRMDQKMGFAGKSGLSNDLMLYNTLLKDQLEQFEDEFTIYSADLLSSSLNRFYVLLLLAGLVITGALFFYSSKFLASLDKLIPSLKKLSEGDIPEPLSLNSYPETREMAEYTNKISANLKKKINYALSIGENDRNTDHPGFTENDGLGNALQKLNKKLLAARKEDQRRMVEEQKRNWFNEGLAQFAGIFRSDEENIGELAYLIIYKLVKYLGASHGMFFILNEEDDKTVRTFDLTAAFALDRRKFLQKKIYPGEGLAGTAALDKQTIFLTDIPDEYITITTGLGESPPRSLLIVPLINEKESIGILEIASFGILTDLEIEFVEKLSESLSTTLSSARKNIKTMKLLRQTKLQAEEMARQEEEMRKNIYEMERTQEESIRKEFEMNGILNAINNSSMMAEYSLNGRFAKINEKFAALLELPPAQIIGKHHSEFSTANRHSPEYKTFWHELKNGKTKFLHEEFQLFNGRKNWLRQTYTPIQNNEGKTVKILNIAYDITETRLQQESLKRQSEEIARKNIEMRSLSEAVDQSIIKCELSPEGIVMQVNTNYCEVTGLSATELLGKNLRLFLKESEIKSLNLILNQVVKGKIYSGVVRRTKPTGEQTWLMSNFSPVKDEKGKVCKIYFLAQDITEKRLKYQLLEEANKEIERLRSKPDTNKG